MVGLTETIMAEQRRGSHTVTRLTVHIVWMTKYRYAVLKGEIQKRCRELIMQVCDVEDVKILKGVVSNEYEGEFLCLYSKDKDEKISPYRSSRLVGFLHSIITLE